MSIATTAFVSGLPGVRRAALRISPGILTRVSIQSEKEFNTLGNQFWYAMLAEGPDPDDGVVDTVTAGYMSYPMGVSWHGFLEIPSDRFLIVEAVSSGSISTDAIIRETRVVLTVNGFLTQWLLKVNGVPQ